MRAAEVRGALAAAGLILACSCGYRPVYPATADAPREARLALKLVGGRVPDAVAADEVLAGAREELARHGLLAPGEGYPRLEIEVLRVDTTSEGIAAVGRDPFPRARGTEVGLVARAWVKPSADAPAVHDTGDVRALDVIAASEDPEADLFRHTNAIRAVGRRLGERLARKVLGFGAVADEALPP